MIRLSLTFLAAMAALSSPLLAIITTLDLTTAGAQQTGTANVGGTFIVRQISPQSTGTGVIDPFVRIQAHNNEQGYNTSLSAPLDTKPGPWTRALQLSEIPIVNVGGTNYRQFLLDINQNSGASNEILSLSQIQIFQLNGDRNNGVVNPASDGNNTSALTFSGSPTTTQIFKMSATTTNDYTTIKMDYSLNSGSGSGDMFLFVRDTLFSPLKSNVIMYSDFGSDPAGFGSNDGFEEWAVLKSSSSPCIGCEVVPEPASVTLLGTLIVGVGALALKKRRAAA
jgi:hypothetical protein